MISKKLKAERREQKTKRVKVNQKTGTLAGQLAKLQTSRAYRGDHRRWQGKQAKKIK
jgi:hypothetical protein